MSAALEVNDDVLFLIGIILFLAHLLAAVTFSTLKNLLPKVSVLTVTEADIIFTQSRTLVHMQEIQAENNKTLAKLVSLLRSMQYDATTESTLLMEIKHTVDNLSENQAKLSTDITILLERTGNGNGLINKSHAS